MENRLLADHKATSLRRIAKALEGIANALDRSKFEDRETIIDEGPHEIGEEYPIAGIFGTIQEAKRCGLNCFQIVKGPDSLVTIRYSKKAGYDADGMKERT